MAHRRRRLRAHLLDGFDDDDDPGAYLVVLRLQRTGYPGKLWDL